MSLTTAGIMIPDIFERVSLQNSALTGSPVAGFEDGAGCFRGIRPRCPRDGPGTMG